MGPSAEELLNCSSYLAEVKPANIKDCVFRQEVISLDWLAHSNVVTAIKRPLQQPFFLVDSEP